MVLSSGKEPHRFSWSEYKDWPAEERWQIIDGRAYNMTPAPSIRHQIITGNFYRTLGNQLAGKICSPFIAPTDVVFDDHNIVQPDVFVVCDSSKFTEANVQGSPDLVIEVLSPTTEAWDRGGKFQRYQQMAALQEYVLIAQDQPRVERYERQGDEQWLLTVTTGLNGVLSLRSIGCELGLADIYRKVAFPEDAGPRR